MTELETCVAHHLDPTTTSVGEILRLASHALRNCREVGGRVRVRSRLWSYALRHWDAAVSVLSGQGDLIRASTSSEAPYERAQS